jgi:hypothetical protein
MEVSMKCAEIDIISYIEGTFTEEVRVHIERCGKCRREADALARLGSLVGRYYNEGERYDRELEERVGGIDLRNMKDLPQVIEERLTVLKKRRLGARLKEVLGKGRQSVQELAENMFVSDMVAQPAAPKDLVTVKTRSGKNVKKAVKKNVKKKGR